MRRSFFASSAPAVPWTSRPSRRALASKVFMTSPCRNGEANPDRAVRYLRSPMSSGIVVRRQIVERRLRARCIPEFDKLLCSPLPRQSMRPASATQSQTFRIVHRRQAYPRLAHLAQDVDLEALAVASQSGGYIAGGKAPADTMTVGARGHVADRRAVP